jgi:hypothetical protein
MTTPTPTLDTEARDTFAAHFPPNKRGTIANLFLHLIRAGVTDPRQVVTDVLGELYRRLENAAPWATEQYLDDASAVATIIQEHRDEAVAFAKYYVDYEALPDVERQAMKTQRSEEHRAVWMAGQPPTAKQLGYLQKLGYAGPAPTSKQDASAQIDRLLAMRGKAGRI